MGFVITSRKFYDEFTGNGGGGVTYLNACQGDKITCVIEGYFYWALESVKVQFSALDNSITLSGLSISNSFLTQGFKEGDQFEIVGSTSNDGSYTIASITDKVIITNEAVATETGASVSFYGTTPITDIDYYYDLIPNNSTKADFISATDVNTVQKYTSTGLDANVGTPVYMNVATDSQGWVTDVMTGNNTEGFIEGVFVTDYKQYFKITTVFYMTRIWTNELQKNFADRYAPEEYQKGNHLKHIFRIDGKYDPNDPFVSQSVSYNSQNGVSGWFNQSNTGNKPEYSVTSIMYQNDATLEILTSLDASIVNLVTVTLYSRSGKFQTGASQFILNSLLCPLNKADYVDTTTTLLENIRLDKAIITSDSASINGINYGTDYQTITNAEVLFVSANYVTLTFNVDYSTATKTILANKSANDRLFAFYVACQDVAITTTKNVDRVSVLVDFNLADYDTREDSNFALLDYIHCYRFPNFGVFESNNVGGYEGDPAYIEIPFNIETLVVNGVSPTLDSMNVQIVATKTGEDDFILEEKTFNTSTVRKLNDVQTIDLTSSRGFILPEDSPFNRANIVRYEDGDSGTTMAYKLQYAFVLRYESWLQVVQSANGYSYDIFKDITDVVEAWKRFNTGYGWALKLRMNANVVGYNGATTLYQAETTFNILDDTDAPDNGPSFKGETQYFDLDWNEIDGILSDEPTYIRTTFSGEVGVYPTGMTSYNAFMWVDNENGSIYSRRIASTDLDSEDDSPFSVEYLPTINGAVASVESNNLRITEMGNRFIVDTIYTPNLNEFPITMSLSSRIGYNEASILLQENGSAILQENSDYILLE